MLRCCQLLELKHLSVTPSLKMRFIKFKQLLNNSLFQITGSFITELNTSLTDAQVIFVSGMFLSFWKSSLIADGDCTRIPKRIQLPKPFKLWWLRRGILGFRHFFCVSLEGITNSNKLYLHWLFFIFFCLCASVSDIGQVWLLHGQHIIFPKW